MTRVGLCKQCGKCCTHVGWIQENVVGFDEWAAARGLDVTYENGGRDVRVLVPNVCPQFISVGGESMCRLHGTPDKPDICQQSPTEPAQVLPGCGFSFED